MLGFHNLFVISFVEALSLNAGIFSNRKLQENFLFPTLQCPSAHDDSLSGVIPGLFHRHNCRSK